MTKVDLNQIQPYETLGFTTVSDDAEQVVMTVPGSGNKNDKMTMFAGSQFSGLVLAGWRLVANWTQEHLQTTCPIVIKSTQTEFKRPVEKDLLCRAFLADTPSQQKNGNWKMLVRVEGLDEDGQLCVFIEGDYRVLPKRDA